MKGISALVMLSEGTLLSGGERDRKIIAWDTLQNYKKITETKVGGLCSSSVQCYLVFVHALGSGARIMGLRVLQLVKSGPVQLA
jgi:hypothetical protein